MVRQIFAERTKEKLSKPDAVWLMKELGILRVHVAGVFNMDLREVLPNVLIASICEGLKSGGDFMSITKVCVYVFTDILLSLTIQVDNPAMCSALYMHFVALVQYIDRLTTIYHTFTQTSTGPCWCVHWWTKCQSQNGLNWAGCNHTLQGQLSCQFLNQL